MRVALALALAGLVCPTASVQAQERVRLSVNGGIQSGSRTVTQSFAVPINLEAAPIGNDIDLSGGGLFDLGVSYHLTRGLWAGVAFSTLSRPADGEVTAAIPHPLFFNRPRNVSGTAMDLTSTEKDLHISASYLVPLSDKLEIALFGGPTKFFITQDLVTDVDYQDTFPYDTAQFSSATITSVSGSTWGFNIGVDVTWKLSRMFGVGGLVRFTRGSTTLTADPGNEVSFDAGGTQVAGGLRVSF